MTPTTLLLRHAHPNFMDGDQITCQVFMQTLGNQSSGLWALTKTETDSESVPASADPLPNFPSH